MTDFLLSLFSPITGIIGIAIVFFAHLYVCFKAKSRTARLMPIAIFLVASNSWLLAMLDHDAREIIIGFALISLFFLFCSISCGLAWLVYRLTRPGKKYRYDGADSEVIVEVPVEPTAPDKRRSKRKTILTIVQISYIILIFAAVAILRSTTIFMSVHIWGFIYSAFTIVASSIALVFVIKSIVIGIIALIRSKQYLRLGATSVLIISVVLCLWHGLVIPFSISESNYAAEITDENRGHVASLIEDAYERIFNYEDFPGLDNATKIKHINNFLDDEFEIYYEDGTTYRLSVNGGIYSLGQYIYDEGYNVYLLGPDYTRDWVTATVTGALSIFSAAVLLACRIKKREDESAEEAKEPVAI